MKSKILALLIVAATIPASAISINTFGTGYTENFDALASSSTSSTVPAGWAFSESGVNANLSYTANNGGSTTGDTYSYGASSSSERAFGTLLSGNLVSTIGVHFENLTGGTITSLLISYTGEQWRWGASLGRTTADRLDFQYSLDAIGLVAGTWINENNLDFATPNLTGSAGARDGILAINRTSLSFTITGLAIPDKGTLWLRWLDSDVIPGGDDGLAVDDFSLTAHGILPPPPHVPDTGTTAILLSIPLLGFWTLRRLTTRPV